MKIVSDFDGVFTNPIGEADAIFRDFVQVSGSHHGLSDLEIQSVLNQIRRAPWDYGWEHSGRLSAFANEDPFIELIALSSHLGLRDVANACFHHVKKSSLALEPSAVAAAQRAIDQGHEIVIVSNSSSDRIERILESTGLVLPRGIRVRGDAQKYVTTPSSPTLTIDRYAIPLDRPIYREVLLSEKPDLVVGDVFSLDLSLPAALRAQGLLPHVQIALVERPYSPAWSQDYVRGLSGVGRVVSDLAEALRGGPFPN